MTNRDRLIEALRGTAPDAVYRHVLLEQVPDEMCIACIEDWLSQELEFEMEGITNA